MMARAQTPLCCLSHEGHTDALKTEHCPPTLRSLLFVVEREMSPIGFRIRTLAPPLPPPVGAVWEDYRTSRRWSLARGSVSLGEGCERS